MITFGHYYLGSAFVVYDVCEEASEAGRRFVASLSEDPRVRFAALDPAEAVTQLKRHLAELAWQRATRAA